MGTNVPIDAFSRLRVYVLRFVQGQWLEDERSLWWSGRAVQFAPGNEKRGVIKTKEGMPMSTTRGMRAPTQVSKRVSSRIGAIEFSPTWVTSDGDDLYGACDDG